VPLVCSLLRCALLCCERRYIDLPKILFVFSQGILVIPMYTVDVRRNEHRSSGNVRYTVEPLIKDTAGEFKFCPL
jgi:hypothetical protein